MKGEQKEVKEATRKIGAKVHAEKKKEFEGLVKQTTKMGAVPKDMMGMSDAMVEALYGQAYRLYNTGKYKDASQLFRLLVMLDPTEGKYTMGLAACFHMLKEYKSAVTTYGLCSMTDPQNPIPHFHASDCYIQMGDAVSALIELELAVRRSGNDPKFATLKDRSTLTIQGLKKELKAKGLLQE